jgi:hypothetical protein
VRFSDAGHEEVDMYGAQNAVQTFLVPASPEVPTGQSRSYGVHDLSRGNG